MPKGTKSSERKATPKQVEYLCALTGQHPWEVRKLSASQASERISTLKARGEHIRYQTPKGFVPTQGSKLCLMDKRLRQQVSQAYPEFTPMQLGQFTQGQGIRLLAMKRSEETGQHT